MRRARLPLATASPNRGKKKAKYNAVRGLNSADRPIVVTVTTEDALEPPIVTESGEIEHDTVGGAPVQLKLIGSL